MPTSRPRKRQPQLGEFVELTPEVTILSEFVSQILMPDGRGSCTVHVRTHPSERKPRLIDFSMHFTEPPMVAEVTDEQVRRVTEYAIVQHATTVAADRMIRAEGGTHGTSENFAREHPEIVGLPGLVVLDDGQLDEVEAATRLAVQPKPGRRPISAADKLAVLELYRTKKVPEIMKITGKKERTIRRWIADAKDLYEAEHGEPWERSEG